MIQYLPKHDVDTSRKEIVLKYESIVADLLILSSLFLYFYAGFCFQQLRINAARRWVMCTV